MSEFARSKPRPCVNCVTPRGPSNCGVSSIWTDCVVIGAGVVGLAVAREMANAGLETLVLERHDIVGAETSSRNSEVIHAGIYYPPGSLKARLCIEGKQRLYDWCRERDVAYRNCGKLVVATREEDFESLKRISARADACGVHDLQWLDQRESKAREPDLSCLACLYSPSTGIVDSHELMTSLQADLEAHGGMVVFRSPVQGGTCEPDGITLTVGQPGEESELKAKLVINCAGLSATDVAGKLDGVPAESVPSIHFAKGNYFSLSGKAPFSHLVYPVPQAASLGVHLAFDLAGRARFGPDVQWVDEISYEVDVSQMSYFYESIRAYWPDLPDDSLAPDYCGIRPKLQALGTAARDFLIQGPSEHGASGLVNLYGIDSPGLTSSLAIAVEVRRRLAH